MNEWLQQGVGEWPALPWQAWLVRQGIALGLGILVTLVYRATRHSDRTSQSFPATLVMLTLLITLTTQVIGDNVARAFSLVGALSIVRFRTVVRDTKDTAFVIFAVVLGMAVGAGQTIAGVCGLGVVTLAAWLYRDLPVGTSAEFVDYKLAIKLAYSPEIEQAIITVLNRVAHDLRPSGAITNRQGIGLELQYKLRLSAAVSPASVVAELVRIDGIQNVDLRQENEDA